MFTKKQQIILLSILILFALLSIVFIFYFQNNTAILFFKKFDNGNLDCVTQRQENIVQGTSLSGAIEEGNTVTILHNYYKCNKIERDDIVAYEYSSQSDPIIKFIKAIPGDSFSLIQDEGGNYNIKVNNNILKTTGGQPYSLSENKSKMLQLFEKNYNGLVPENSYLLLGNKYNGSVDSTQFGLIDQSGIIGKVAVD